MTTYLVKYAVKLIQTLLIPNQFLKKHQKRRLLYSDEQSIELEYQSIIGSSIFLEWSYQGFPIFVL
jgi:hypothetical protein